MELLSHNWRKIWEPKDRRPIYEYLEDHWELGPAYTKTGLFRIQDSRHLIALFDSYQNERKRETNVCAPTRGGKTLWMDGCHLWVPKIRPANTLVLFQEDKAVKDQCEMRLWPNVEKCKPVAELLSKDAQKNRLTEIIFPHMYMHVRGPADSNLSSRGYQDVWIDEPWLYKEGKIEEARARLGDFVKMGTDKLQCLSQGGYVGSEWWRQYNRGLIHEWCVQCLACGHHMRPLWSGRRDDGSRWGMRWDAHKMTSGLWDIERCKPSIRFECEKCGHPHTWSTRTKNEWNRTGKYIPEDTSDKSEKKDSFHWTAVIDTPWENLVDLYLNAVNAWKTGAVEPLIKFFQKSMAEMCSEESLLENSINLRRTKIEVETQPPAGCYRVMAVDRQGEQVYWVLICDLYKATEDSLPKIKKIYYGKHYSALEIKELQDKYGIESQKVFIDSGFEAKGSHGVYASCIRYGWIPTKGTKVGQHMTFLHDMDGAKAYRTYSEPIIVDSECGTGPGRFCQMIRFSSDAFSGRVSELIDRGIFVSGEDENDPMEKEFKRQVSAEYQKEVIVGNKAMRRKEIVFVCPSGNNHGRDCLKLVTLEAVLLDVLPDLDVAA